MKILGHLWTAGQFALGTTMVSRVSSEGLPNKTFSSKVSHFYVLFFVFYVTVITFAVIRVISAAARPVVELVKRMANL